MVNFNICKTWDQHDQRVDRTCLRAHQRVDWNKVTHMDAVTLAKPVLASQDKFVLDGNHRWNAHVLNNSNLDAYVIGLDFEKAIQLLFAFPKTYSYGDGNLHPVTN